jgi:hypothetical protein
MNKKKATLIGLLAIVLWSTMVGLIRASAKAWARLAARR